MGRLVFAAACGTLLLSACGARTGQLPPWITDGGAARVDAPATDGWASDLLVRPDGPVADACLPIPAAQVQGQYTGSWKGTWHCPGMGQQPVNGTLSFYLNPSGGSNSFSVYGMMKGQVVGSPVPMPFETKVAGTMGCVALSADLPAVNVGTGGLIILLKGTMTGAFSAPPGGKPGYTGGSWKAQEITAKPCTASGSWSAFQ